MLKSIIGLQGDLCTTSCGGENLIGPVGGGKNLLYINTLIYLNLLKNLL